MLSSMSLATKPRGMCESVTQRPHLPAEGTNRITYLKGWGGQETSLKSARWRLELASEHGGQELALALCLRTHANVTSLRVTTLTVGRGFLRVLTHPAPSTVPAPAAPLCTPKPASPPSQAPLNPLLSGAPQPRGSQSRGHCTRKSRVSPKVNLPLPLAAATAQTPPGPRGHRRAPGSGKPWRRGGRRGPLLTAGPVHRGLLAAGRHCLPHPE